MLLIENSINNDWERCEKYVIKLIDPRVVNCCTRETIDEAKPELRQD